MFEIRQLCRPIFGQKCISLIITSVQSQQKNILHFSDSNSWTLDFMLTTLKIGLPAASARRKKYTKNYRKIYQMTKNIPNDRKTYQMTEKYTKWPKNISDDRKIYQMTEKYIKRLQNIPNDRKIYQMAIKYTELPWNIQIDLIIYLHTFFISRTSKLHSNWYFWYGNLPTGKPGVKWNQCGKRM
jgi:predicted nucleic acid-binding protein